ncbi:MAG: hypothetical protein JWO52_8187 [Gammaproteobacteria bacterium]|nr:hypothetical protein [Gammaproteobacteria bacterium]
MLIDVVVICSNGIAIFFPPSRALHTCELFSQSALKGGGQIDASLPRSIQQVATNAYVCRTLCDSLGAPDGPADFGR